TQIESLQAELPELPNEKYARFVKNYALPASDAEILTRETSLADYFEEAVKVGTKESVTAKQIANTIINKKIDISQTKIVDLIKQIQAASQTVQVDEAELETIIKQVLKENAQAVADYKKGKVTVIMFLVGMVMRKVGKKIDAQMVKQKLIEKFE